MKYTRAREEQSNERVKLFKLSPFAIGQLSLLPGGATSKVSFISGVASYKMTTWRAQFSQKCIVECTKKRFLSFLVEKI